MVHGGHLDCLPQWQGETRAETARREKNAVRASAVENWSTALRGPSPVRARWLIMPTFFFFSIQYLRLLSAVLARWKI